jgi:hypothetical protein
MGKLIKNHWARLIILTSACCKCSRSARIKKHTLSTPTNLTSHADQLAGALEGFFWPKFFFDFLTKNFDAAVKPVPILQVLNVIIALICLAYEWPLRWVAGTHLHRSIVARLLWLPLATLSAVLLYQTTNAALYYLIGCGIYFWAYSEGEVSAVVDAAVRSVMLTSVIGNMCRSLDVTEEGRS